MKGKDLLECLILGAIVVIIIFAYGFQPYMEMKAWNKGAKPEARITYWEAVFVEYRIIQEK